MISHMPSAENLAHVDAYRAHQLGVAPDVLHRASVVVVSHGPGLEGYQGVYALRSGDSLVVSAPDALQYDLESAVAGRKAEATFNAALLSGTLGGRVERVIGPAWIGHADNIVGEDVRGSRLLDADDANALLRLREACDPADWEHSGIDPALAPIFGVHDDGALIAAASWQALDERIRHVGFVTDPARRGRGFGRAVAAAITTHGAREGAIMQWQTLVSNAPSLAVGRALGYEHRFDSLAFRLREV